MARPPAPSAPKMESRLRSKARRVRRFSVVPSLLPVVLRWGCSTAADAAVACGAGAPALAESAKKRRRKAASRVSLRLQPDAGATLCLQPADAESGAPTACRWGGGGGGGGDSDESAR